MAIRTRTKKNPTQDQHTATLAGLTVRPRWHRHLLMALCSAGLVGVFWSTRSNWVAEMPLWKAVGDAAYVLLLAALALGYEFIPQLGREARLEPGFGLANLIGSAALALAMILGATSSDRALRRLRRPAWTWLHRLAQTILVLSLLHGSYFLFIHFTESFHKAAPPNLDWFRIPFLTAGLAVIALQAAALWIHDEQGAATVAPATSRSSRRGR
jgi:sulfoxide reductase heme-binding subunit YedZ